MTTSPTTIDRAAGAVSEAALSEVPARAAGALIVDLPAIAENYRRLKSAFLEKAVAAVVKADGYGLGAGRVAPPMGLAIRGF